MKILNGLVFMFNFLLVSCATAPTNEVIKPSPLSSEDLSISGIPQPIRQASAKDLPLAEVLGNIEANRGAKVRWGGTIQALENEPGWTRIEVIAHPLGQYGEPQPQQPSSGRFMVRAQIPYDPKVYEMGREITVAGTVQGTAEGSGEGQPSRLPLVEAEQLYFWGQSSEPGDAWTLATHPPRVVLPDCCYGYYPGGYYPYPSLSLGFGYWHDKGYIQYWSFDPWYWPYYGWNFGYFFH